MKNPIDMGETSGEHKSLRKSLLLLILLLILAGILAFAPRSYLLRQFETFQRSEVERNIAMLRYALQAEETNLNNVCQDWAEWDDMYLFVQEQNQQFIDSNLHMEHLKGTLNLDLLSIYNRDKQILWGDIYLPKNHEGKPENKVSFPKEINLLVSRNYTKQLSGYVLSDHGLMLISISPILPTSGEGMAQGVLLMGRFLNEGLVQNISQHTQLALKLPGSKYDTYPMEAKDIFYKLQKATYMIDSSDKEHPVIYMSMQDLYGGSFIISFNLPQTIMFHGSRAANFVALAFIAALLLVIAGFLSAFAFYNKEVRRKRQELADLLEKRSQELAESEKIYRQLFEIAEDGIYIIDLNFILLDSNRNAYERLGYSREEAIGQHVSLFLPPEIQESLIKWREKMLKVKSIRYESCHIKKDGSILPIEVSSQLLEHQDQLKILNIARDITRRKQLEEASQASERRYRTIFENSPAGIAYLNGSGRVLSANPQMSLIMGTGFERLIGQSIFDLLAGYRFTDEFNEAAKGFSINYEAVYNNPLSGESQLLKVFLNPIIIGERPFDVLCLVQDLTELRRDEEKLRQLYTAIEQSPIVVVISDLLGNTQFTNQAFTKISGYSVEEVIGQNPLVLNDHTQEPDLLKEIWDTILSGKVWYGELQQRKKSGSLFWGKVVIAPIRDAGDNISNFVSIMEEISEQKLMAQVEALLAQLEKEALEWSTEQINQFCLEEVMKLSDSPLGFLAYRYKNKHTIVSRIKPGDRESECSLSPNLLERMMDERNIWGQSFREKRPLFSNDLAGIAMEVPPGHVNVKRVMAIPIIHGEEVVGLIGLANKEEEYNEMDQNVASMFARNAWLTIRRQQAEKLLRESEERTRRIFNAVQAGIVLIDAESRKIVEANPSALEMFGGIESELKGKPCHEVFYKDRGDICPVLDLGAMSDSSERVLFRADGSQLPILKTVTQLYIGKKLFLLESFLDMSELKEP